MSLGSLAAFDCLKCRLDKVAEEGLEGTRYNLRVPILGLGGQCLQRIYIAINKL